jgi:hypothetical protein
MTIDELDLYISREILPHFKRSYDVDGAPFKIGDHVTVLNNPNGDDTFDVRFVGQDGFVKHFEYDCGCGQTFPVDPMIGVKFDDGQIEEFWKEELVLTA